MSALPGWFQWRNGMLTTCGLRVYDVDVHGLALGIRESDRRGRPETVGLPHDAEPDPADPATIGCLTARVRELANRPGLSFYQSSVTGLWLPAGPMLLPPRLKDIAATSEWAALMAAGDAAWARRGGAA